MATQAKPNVVNLREEKKPDSLSLTQLALRRLRRDKLTLTALAFVVFLAIVAFTAPITTRYILNVDYTRPDTTVTFLKIGAPGHILGTDDLGRDFLARLMYGGQLSLLIAFFSAVLSLTIGVSLGVITGYFGGIIDDIVNWIIATLGSIPSLFLLLIVSSTILQNPALAGSIIAGPISLILIFGLLGWLGTARLVRGETLSLREREYIVGARAIGASPWKIMFSHIVPNLLSVVIITLATDIGALILAESALSFLGLGVRQPTPTWGNMLTDAQTYFNKGIHLVIIPGLLISFTVLCLYVVGDGLRDAFDPTTVD